jgi:hypothetical protein
MEAADTTTIMENDCQQRMAVGAAMVMVGSNLAAKTTNQRICVEILLSSGKARQRSEVKCRGLTKCWPTSTYRSSYVNSYMALLVTLEIFV